MDRVVTLKPCLALQLKSLLAILKILFNVEEVLRRVFSTEPSCKCRRSRARRNPTFSNVCRPRWQLKPSSTAA